MDHAPHTIQHIYTLEYLKFSSKNILKNSTKNNNKKNSFLIFLMRYIYKINVYYVRNICDVQKV